MSTETPKDLTTLEVGPQMWDRFFTVSPLNVLDPASRPALRNPRDVARLAR